MIWLMEILKILQEEQVLINFERDKAFNIAKNSKYDEYQRGLASMIYNFCDKNLKGSGIYNNDNNNNNNKDNNNNNNKQNYNQLKNDTSQLLKTLKKKVYSGFKDNIWGANLADLQLISKFNKGFRFLLCLIDSFSKYAWVIML